MTYETRLLLPAQPKITTWRTATSLDQLLSISIPAPSSKIIYQSTIFPISMKQLLTKALRLQYTLPSGSFMVNCPLYFSALSGLSRTCHAQDQATTSLQQVQVFT